MNGKYAMMGDWNWPAQLLICGDPPGSSSCSSASYNASMPIYLPGEAGGWVEGGVWVWLMLMRCAERAACPAGRARARACVCQSTPL